MSRFTGRFGLVLVTMVLSGCATKSETVSIYRATFDYEPPSRAKPSAAGVAIALVAPQYSEDALWSQIAPSMPRDMGRDFEELLTARGYTIRGPFKTYDYMVYSDKQNTDLVLTPILEIDARVVDFAVDQTSALLGLGPKMYVITNGTVQLSGRVTLSAAESLTNTKLWVKSIDLPDTVVAFTGQLKYKRAPTAVSVQEPALRSAVGRALERMYTLVLQSTWDYLDPQEMLAKKVEADEIKQKAGFDVTP